jgi:hypothetical protein
LTRGMMLRTDGVWTGGVRICRRLRPRSGVESTGVRRGGFAGCIHQDWPTIINIRTRCVFEIPDMLDYTVIKCQGQSAVSRDDYLGPGTSGDCKSLSRPGNFSDLEGTQNQYRVPLPCWIREFYGPSSSPITKKSAPNPRHSARAARRSASSCCRRRTSARATSPLSMYLLIDAT